MNRSASALLVLLPSLALAAPPQPEATGASPPASDQAQVAPVVAPGERVSARERRRRIRERAAAEGLPPVDPIVVPPTLSEAELRAAPRMPDVPRHQHDAWWGLHRRWFALTTDFVGVVTPSFAPTETWTADYMSIELKVPIVRWVAPTARVLLLRSGIGLNAGVHIHLTGSAPEGTYVGLAGVVTGLMPVFNEAPPGGVGIEATLGYGLVLRRYLYFAPKVGVLFSTATGASVVVGLPMGVTF